jgi:hypothetical protein
MTPVKSFIWAKDAAGISGECIEMRNMPGAGRWELLATAQALELEQLRKARGIQSGLGNKGSTKSVRYGFLDLNWTVFATTCSIFSGVAAVTSRDRM